MKNKLIEMIATRLVEIVILFIGGIWLWSSLPESLQLWTMIGVSFTYGVYFVVTFGNDLMELKRGKGEVMM